MKALEIIRGCAFAATIIALPFLLVNWAIYLKQRPVNTLATRSGFPIKSVSFFVISCVTAISVDSVMTTYAQHEAINFLQGLSGSYTMYVNEREVRDPEKLISALKTLAPQAAHHSHPTKRIRVLISSEEKYLTLELGRDSDNPQEYWVFSSGASNGEIGRITSAAFDEY